jgi:hypothetical protein
MRCVLRCRQSLQQKRSPGQMPQPWQTYARMTDEELQAIRRYLATFVD